MPLSAHCWRDRIHSCERKGAKTPSRKDSAHHITAVASRLRVLALNDGFCTATETNGARNSYNSSSTSPSGGVTIQCASSEFRSVSLVPFTAMPSARYEPTSTTSFFPRVTPV